MKLLTILVALCLFLASCSDDTVSKYNDTEAEEGTEMGNLIPDFVLKNEAGKDFHFNKYRGKVLLLKFWSPTCGYCISSMPKTIEINDDYYSENFRAVSINRYGTFENWKSNIEKYEMQSLINLFEDVSYNNASESIFYAFSITGIPYYVLLDKYGVIKFKGNANQSSLLSLIEELIEQ